MAKISHVQDAQGAKNAEEVERLLLSGHHEEAENKFRQHYIDTIGNMSSSDAGNVLAAERAHLKSMDSNGYNLLILESAKHIPELAEEHITKKDLALMSRLPNNPSATDRFNADTAKDMLPQYDNLTGSQNVWNKFNPLNQSGFTISDVTRVGRNLEVDENKRGMAAMAANTFMRNNGELLDKLAGVSGTIDRSTLGLALDKDSKTKLLTADQRTAMQWMRDNWDDPAVNQLKNGKDTWEDYNRFLPSLNFEGTRAAAKIGWQHGNSWGGVAAGAVEAAAAGLSGFIGAGAGPLGATGSLTRESLRDAYKNNFGENTEALSALDSRSKPYALPKLDLSSEGPSNNAREQGSRLSAPNLSERPKPEDDTVRDEFEHSPSLRQRNQHRDHDVSKDEIRHALTVHKHESYWQSAERLIRLAGERPAGKDIRRVSRELWEADGRPNIKHLKSGHVIKLTDSVLKDRSLTGLRQSD